MLTSTSLQASFWTDQRQFWSFISSTRTLEGSQTLTEFVKLGRTPYFFEVSVNCPVIFSKGHI
jgi:hypothetical protein